MSFMVDGMELIMLGGVALIAWYLGFRLPEKPPPTPVPVKPWVDTYPYQPPPPRPPDLAQDSEECKRLWQAYVAFRRNGDSGSAFRVMEDARQKGCLWPDSVYREATPVRLLGGLAGAAGTALGGISPSGATGTPTAPATAPTGVSGGPRQIGGSGARYI